MAELFQSQQFATIALFAHFELPHFSCRCAVFLRDPRSAQTTNMQCIQKNNNYKYRLQDLLAAADIGEMLLEKNRSLTQKVVELQRELEEQVTHVQRSMQTCLCNARWPR
jgi:hypothetical protein